MKDLEKDPHYKEYSNHLKEVVDFLRQNFIIEMKGASIMTTLVMV